MNDLYKHINAVVTASLIVFDKQVSGRTDRHTERQKYRQTDRHKQTDRLTGISDVHFVFERVTYIYNEGPGSEVQTMAQDVDNCSGHHDGPAPSAIWVVVAKVNPCHRL